MHPDDRSVGQRYPCSMAGCKEFTTRPIGKQYVCETHFKQGYGRLPGMPLPGSEAPVYVSDKDKKAAKDK